MADEQLDSEIIERMQFVKVIVREGLYQNAGFLTDASAKMLLVDLRRDGFDVVKKHP